MYLSHEAGLITEQLTLSENDFFENAIPSILYLVVRLRVRDLHEVPLWLAVSSLLSLFLFGSSYTLRLFLGSV